MMPATTTPEATAARLQDGYNLADLVTRAWEAGAIDRLNDWEQLFLRGMAQLIRETALHPTLSAKQVGTLKLIASKLQIPFAPFSGVDFGQHRYREVARSRKSSPPASP